MKDIHALGMSAGIEEQAFKNLFLIRLIFNDGRLSKIISFIKRPLLFFLSEHALSRSALLAKKVELLKFLMLGGQCRCDRRDCRTLSLR